MLVFSRRKYGGPVLDGVPVPGYLDPLPPVRISHLTYWKNRGSLRLAQYTKAWFEERFDGTFPDVVFSYNELKYLSYIHLVDLCQAFKITSPNRKSHNARLVAIREFLRENC